MTFDLSPIPPPEEVNAVDWIMDYGHICRGHLHLFLKYGLISKDAPMAAVAYALANLPAKQDVVVRTKALSEMTGQDALEYIAQHVSAMSKEEITALRERSAGVVQLPAHR
jgi:hypothetical protein